MKTNKKSEQIVDTDKERKESGPSRRPSEMTIAEEEFEERETRNAQARRIQEQCNENKVGRGLYNWI